MAFVYCPSCNWSQEFGYKEGWDLVSHIGRDIERLREMLYKEEVKFDQSILSGLMRFPEIHTHVRPGRGEDSGSIFLPGKVYVAYELLSIAHAILQTKWLTEKEFEEDKEKRCPWCGTRVRVD